MNCDLCDSEISPARMAAVPGTRLCLSCKMEHDEPKLQAHAPVLRGSLVENSIGDLEEKQAEQRAVAGGLK